MNKIVKQLASMTVIVATVGWTAQALAQAESSIPDAFNDAYYKNATDIFTNRDLLDQVGLVFGFVYPDNQILGDGQAVHELYEELLLQQTTSDRTIRTPDLESPYQTSLLTAPLYVEEPIPPAPPSVFFPQAAPPSAGVRSQPEAPVPALW